MLIEKNLEVMAGIQVERMMIEIDSLYCNIKNTYVGIKYVKTNWLSKKEKKNMINNYS